MAESFRYTSYPQEIIFGAGALEILGDIVAQRNGSRAMLVTTGSQRRNGTIARIETLLGENLVAVLDTIQQHVPQSNVDQALQLALEKNIDFLIALGGGSAIGVAKATSHTLLSQVAQSQAQIARQQSEIKNQKSVLPILAIPTTYAGSEMTAIFGVTRERDGVAKKETTNDPRVVPGIVLYDPQLTLDVPSELTASTGINAFAHCVEAVYSITRNPLATAAALEGARLIFHALPRCFENGTDIDARSEMLQGSYLAGVSLANVAMGLHHGVCHVLGGTANVPHGIANAIILPHAMRFNADVCATELSYIARVVGITTGSDQERALKAAEAVQALVAQLNLPTRLRDAGVRQEDLPKLAELAFQNKTVQNNPKKILDLETMLEFLRRAR